MQESEAGAVGTEQPEQLSDQQLQAAIAASRGAVAQAERAMLQARDRHDRQRRELRSLEAEAERRLTGAVPAAAVRHMRRKRSTTAADALIGRDGIDPDRPFAAFRFLSLQRQEIVLCADGDRAQQALRFFDPLRAVEHLARTFGEARRLQEQGFVQGRERDPLQRHDVWYTGEARAGRLRLDQIFLEQEGETA